MMLVHHDDATREFAYGAESKIGTFSDALMAEAKKDDWTVISMKNDWKKSSRLRNRSEEPNRSSEQLEIRADRLIPSATSPRKQESGFTSFFA